MNRRMVIQGTLTSFEKRLVSRLIRGEINSMVDNDEAVERLEDILELFKETDKVKEFYPVANTTIG